MDENRWFIDIRANGRRADLPKIQQRLVHGLHAIMARFKDEIGFSPVGVAFPHWNSHAIGPVLRLVSQDRDALRHILSEPVISGLADNLYIHLSPGGIGRVPAHLVRGEIAYVRDRTQEKAFVGYWERQNQRRQKRRLDPLSLTTVKPRSLPDGHYVLLTSSHSGHCFNLFIRQHPRSERGCGRFNSYGLSAAPSAVSEDSQLATVPLF